jgi:hypothetical protein
VQGACLDASGQVGVFDEVDDVAVGAVRVVVMMIMIVVIVIVVMVVVVVMMVVVMMGFGGMALDADDGAAAAQGGADHVFEVYGDVVQTEAMRKFLDFAFGVQQGCQCAEKHVAGDSGKGFKF